MDLKVLNSILALITVGCFSHQDSRRENSIYSEEFTLIKTAYTCGEAVETAHGALVSYCFDIVSDSGKKYTLAMGPIEVFSDSATSNTNEQIEAFTSLEKNDRICMFQEKPSNYPLLDPLWLSSEPDNPPHKVWSWSCSDSRP